MIVLMGVPRSGKTSVGKLLANKLEVPFYDLDELVLKECSLLDPKIDSIRSLVKLYGEKKLRFLEREVLANFQNKSCVFALGGGTISSLFPDKVLGGTYVHLVLSFEEFLNRVLVKPLPLTCDTTKGWYLGLLNFYTVRFEACRKIAHKTLDVANRNTGSCVEELVESIS